MTTSSNIWKEEFGISIPDLVLTNTFDPRSKSWLFFHGYKKKQTKRPEKKVDKSGKGRKRGKEREREREIDR